MRFPERDVELEFLRFHLAGGLKAPYAVGLFTVGCLLYFLSLSEFRDLSSSYADAVLTDSGGGLSSRSSPSSSSSSSGPSSSFGSNSKLIIVVMIVMIASIVVTAVCLGILVYVQHVRPWWKGKLLLKGEKREGEGVRGAKGVVTPKVAMNTSSSSRRQSMLQQEEGKGLNDMSVSRSSLVSIPPRHHHRHHPSSSTTNTTTTSPTPIEEERQRRRVYTQEARASSDIALLVDYVVAVQYLALVLGFSMFTFTAKASCWADTQLSRELQRGAMGGGGVSGVGVGGGGEEGGGVGGGAVAISAFGAAVPYYAIQPRYAEVIVYVESVDHYLNICEVLLAPLPIAACMLSLLLQRPRHLLILPALLIDLVAFVVCWAFLDSDSSASVAGLHIGLQAVCMFMVIVLRYMQERFQRKQFIQYAMTDSKLKYVQHEHAKLQSSVEQMLPPPIRRQLQQSSWSLDVAPYCTVALIDIANIDLLFPDEVQKVNTVRVMEPSTTATTTATTATAPPLPLGGGELQQPTVGFGVTQAPPIHPFSQEAGGNSAPLPQKGIGESGGGIARKLKGDAFEALSPVEALRVIVGVERSLTNLCTLYGFARISIFGDMFCCASNLFLSSSLDKQ